MLVTLGVGNKYFKLCTQRVVASPAKTTKLYCFRSKNNGRKQYSETGTSFQPC